MQRISLACLIVALAWAPAWGGDVTLSIHDGRVTLDAKNVTVREILGEWARVGQTRVVNADQLRGRIVSLRLDDVPEDEALATVLRSVSGYLAAPRAAGAAGASRFDRILIMVTSRPPVAGTPVPAPPQVPMSGLTPGENPLEAPAGSPQAPFSPGRRMPPGFPGFRDPSRTDGPFRPAASPARPPQQQQAQPTGPTTMPAAPATSTQPGAVANPETDETSAPGTALPMVPGPQAADPQSGGRPAFE